MRFSVPNRCSPMKELLIKNAVLTGITLALTGMTRVVYNVAIGKSFDAETLGQINLVMSIIMLLAMAVSIILENSSIKFLSDCLARDDVDTIKNIFTILQKWDVLGSSILIIIVFIFIDGIVLTTGSREDLLIVGLPLIFLISAHNFYRGCFYGLNEVNKYFKFELISTISFFIVLIFVIFIWHGYFLIPFIIFYGSFTVLSILNLRSYFKLSNYSHQLKREIGVYGTIAMIGTLASTSKAHIANVLTGIYLSPEQVGYYSAAVSITIILLFAPSIIGRVLLPTISYSYGKGDFRTLRILINKTTLWLSLSSLFLGGITIILSKQILVTLFTPEFAVATFSLQMLVLGICLSTITVPAVSALSGTKYIKIPNAAGVIGLFISLVLWTYLIPQFGINGTAIGYIIGVLANAIVPLYYAKKYYDIDLSQIYFVISISLFLIALTIYAQRFISIYPEWLASIIFTIVFILIFKNKLVNICGEIGLKTNHSN